MGQGQVHLVASPPEGLGVSDHLAAGAGVDVIHARIDAAADDLVAFPVVALGVPSQANSRDHQIRLAQPAVLHIRVVIKNPGCTDRRTGGPDALAHGAETHSRTRCGHRAITHEPAPSHSFIVHRSSPFVIFDIIIRIWISVMDGYSAM
ncbi:hypothetical protein ES703_82353 [subsurface metagenome]